MFGTSIIVRAKDDVWILHNPRLTEGFVRIDWSTISLPNRIASKCLLKEGKLFLLAIIRRLESQRNGSPPQHYY